jgi:hypothetical protein
MNWGQRLVVVFTGCGLIAVSLSPPWRLHGRIQGVTTNAPRGWAPLWQPPTGEKSNRYDLDRFAFAEIDWPRLGLCWIAITFTGALAYFLMGGGKWREGPNEINK